MTQPAKDKIETLLTWIRGLGLHEDEDDFDDEEHELYQLLQDIRDDADRVAAAQYFILTVDGSDPPEWSLEPTLAACAAALLSADAATKCDTEHPYETYVFNLRTEAPMQYKLNVSVEWL